LLSPLFVDGCVGTDSELHECRAWKYSMWFVRLVVRCEVWGMRCEVWLRYEVWGVWYTCGVRREVWGEVCGLWGALSAMFSHKKANLTWVSIFWNLRNVSTTK
jgi:hypothetical protein